MSKDQFTARLAKLRLKSGLSRRELAEKAGLSEQSVHQLERGKNKPTLETARQLARALGCTVDELGEP